MTKIFLLCGVLASCTLTACSEFRERLVDGYPTEDVVIDKDKATPNELADALNQIAKLSLIGDDWEFENEDDRCTITVVEGDTRNARTLSLKDATFSIRRDKHSGKYYATISNRDRVRLDHDGSALRLFETDSYHGLSIAESYLMALAQKCTASLPDSA
jgi:hypothetical protein